MAGMANRLAEWLRAQLDKDAAEIAAEHGRKGWHARGCESLPDILYPDLEPGPCDCGVPARVLREIDAKRRIVRAYEDAVTAFDNTVLGTDLHDLMGGSVNSLRYVLQVLALLYVDRPGFKEEWRP